VRQEIVGELAAVVRLHMHAVGRGVVGQRAVHGKSLKAVDVIDSYLRGSLQPYRTAFVSEKDFDPETVADTPKQARAIMPARPASERKKDFGAVYLGFTDEQAVNEARRCLECGCFDYRECSLIKNAQRYDIDPTRFKGEVHKSFTERELVSIERDQGKCILCSLCVRTCEENAGQGILGLIGRGFNTVIKPEFENSVKLSVCKNCRKCADICPTGALKIL